MALSKRLWCDLEDIREVRLMSFYSFLKSINQLDLNCASSKLKTTHFLVESSFDDLSDHRIKVETHVIVFLFQMYLCVQLTLHLLEGPYRGGFFDIVLTVPKGYPFLGLPLLTQMTLELILLY
jgi:hypothetical protein